MFLYTARAGACQVWSLSASRIWASYNGWHTGTGGGTVPTALLRSNLREDLAWGGRVQAGSLGMADMAVNQASGMWASLRPVEGASEGDREGSSERSRKFQTISGSVHQQVAKTTGCFVESPHVFLRCWVVQHTRKAFGS